MEINFFLFAYSVTQVFLVGLAVFLAVIFSAQHLVTDFHRRPAERSALE